MVAKNFSRVVEVDQTAITTNIVIVEIQKIMKNYNMLLSLGILDEVVNGNFVPHCAL